MYHILSTAFCVIAIVSNIISSKLVPVPFCHDFNVGAGLITYPLTFLISDLVTEIYGAQKARSMVYLAFATSLLSFLIIQATLLLPTANAEGNRPFQIVLGLNGVILFASLLAHIVSQTLDIQLYTWIKQRTGQRLLWLRNNGSTLVAQLADTFIVNTLFFYWGMNMPWAQVVSIMIFSYLYKSSFNFITTPLFYLGVFLMKKSYLPKKS